VVEDALDPKDVDGCASLHPLQFRQGAVVYHVSGVQRRGCSNSIIQHSLSATGRCSTPRGTTRNSPSSIHSCRSRNSMRKRPLTTREHFIFPTHDGETRTQTPRILSSLTYCPFSSAAIYGFQCSEIFPTSRPCDLVHVCAPGVKGAACPDSSETNWSQRSSLRIFPADL